MKKLLPISKPSGFTLIELLIVIAIIAVLSVMGFAAFRGFVGRGNDVRRQADVKAIGDALEANKSTTTGFYVALATSQFASGSIPIDPISGTTHQKYCITYTTNLVKDITFPAPATTMWDANGACTGAGITGGVAGNNTGMTLVAASIPTGSVTAWSVCYATGDNGTMTSNTPLCRNSAQ